MTEDLDAEIDELAVEIELLLQRAKETNEKYKDVFDPRWREMRGQAEALFS